MTQKEMTEITLIESNPISIQKATISNPYITAATSNNTRKAYRSDIRHFEEWGGKLPASADTIISYLQTFAETLNPRTLSRRLTALKQWHVYQGFQDPTQHPSIRKTLTGIMRIHGRPKNKAYPLTPEDLHKMVMLLETNDSITAIRDNALLQIGFFGAFRRSELVNIEYHHIEWKAEGIEILIPTSKTDPNHEGQFCAIPYGSNELCPIRALKKWLDRSGIKNGPIFRRIYMNGQYDPNLALTPLSVNQILKKRALQSGLPHIAKLSSHSMRRGLATSASRSGAGLPAIMRQGRWKQVNTVIEYIEASERFTENAASSVLQKESKSKE